MPNQRKPIFDTVRAILKRGFRPSEVAAMDKATDTAMGEGSGCTSSTRPFAVGAEGIALIKRFEGCARLRRDGLVEAYLDPGTGGEPWTIGWGATGDGLHGRVAPETAWTQAQCDERLEQDLKRYAADVAHALGEAPTTQAQFDAMVSFHYNTGAIARATLTRKHRAGDFEGAAAEFARWNKAGGRVLKGLGRRRAEEARLYSAQ